MPAAPLDLLFLGSGNAFAPDGRAFSSFLLNGRYLFDCGPTVLQQLRKAGVAADDIDAVLISHYHADHFFGLPFLLLDAWHTGRTKELVIVGPPGIEERTWRLVNLGYAMLSTRLTCPLRFIEVRDGMEGEAVGLAFSAAAVDHVSELDCFAFRVNLAGRSLVYSGDTTLCDPLLRLAAQADVLVLECASGGNEPVHLSAEDVAEIVRHTSPGSRTVLTHLDGGSHPLIETLTRERGALIASDLARFSL